MREGVMREGVMRGIKSVRNLRRRNDRARREDSHLRVRQQPDERPRRGIWKGNTCELTSSTCIHTTRCV